MKADPRIVRIAKRLYYRVRHQRRPPHWVEARCAGVRLKFRSDATTAESVYANAFERTQRAALDRLVSPGAVVVDVGANIGFYTCLFAKRVGDEGKVIAIEPTPATFQLLRENVLRNGVETIVDCRQVAVSDGCGRAELHVFPNSFNVYNSLGAATSHGAEAIERVEVETTTLDVILSDAPRDRSCFVKIDVEGFQHQVIQGGLGELTRRRELGLMVELQAETAARCGSDPKDTVQLLADCGFAPLLPRPRGELAPLKSAHAARSSLGGSQDVFFLRRAA